MPATELTTAAESLALDRGEMPPPTRPAPPTEDIWPEDAPSAEMASAPAPTTAPPRYEPGADFSRDEIYTFARALALDLRARHPPGTAHGNLRDNPVYLMLVARALRLRSLRNGRMHVPLLWDYLHDTPMSSARWMGGLSAFYMINPGAIPNWSPKSRVPVLVPLLSWIGAMFIVEPGLARKAAAFLQGLVVDPLGTLSGIVLPVLAAFRWAILPHNAIHLLLMLLIAVLMARWILRLGERRDSAAQLVSSLEAVYALACSKRRVRVVFWEFARTRLPGALLVVAVVVLSLIPAFALGAFVGWILHRANLLPEWARVGWGIYATIASLLWWFVWLSLRHKPDVGVAIARTINAVDDVRREALRRAGLDRPE